MSPLHFRKPFLAILGLAIISACFVASPKHSVAGPSDEISAKIDKLFAQWNRADRPGCAVGVIHQGKVIYKKGVGSANLSYEAPNTPETIFEVGSFSKSFISACIAMLMDEGKISPDDDLRKFLPEMHRFDPPVAIRHMLRCRSGIWAQFHIMPLAGWDNVPIHSPYTQEDLLTVLSGQRRLPFTPGSEFQYGSGDFFLLGVIVKRVTGKSLAEFARERIFEPLGMKRTYFEEDPSLIVKNRATAHFKESDGKWREWKNHGYLPGGGGLNTCVDDLIAWDRNFEKNQLPMGKYFGEFLKEGTLLGNRYVLDADAYRKHVHKSPVNAPAGQYRGLKRIQFTGGVWGMSSAMAWFPHQRLTIICLTNTEEISPWKKTQEIADLILKDQLKPKLTSKGNTKAENKEIKLTAGELQERTGAYRLQATKAIWRIDVKQGRLTLTDHLGKAFPLEPVSKNRFRPTGKSPFYDSARFVFERESSQSPFTLTLTSFEDGVREVLPFERVKLVDPKPEALQSYVGEYVSGELAAVYRIRLKESALWLRVGSRRWEQLDPTVRDEFVAHRRHPHDNRVFSFRRNAKNEVTGFGVSFWRIRGVDFQKRSWEVK